LYEELVANHVRLLGPDHPRTLHARLELLRWKGLPGHAAPETVAFAGRLLDRVLDRVRDVLGPGHGDFPTQRYQLMSEHLIAGDINAAIDLKRRYPSPDDEDEFQPSEHDRM
jgi:hypothetical protein